VLLVAAVVLIDSSHGDYRDYEKDGPAPVVASGVAYPTKLPAAKVVSDSGGQVKVVEQGYSQRFESVDRTLTPGYGPGNPEPYTPVQAAFVLENTSKDQVAVDLEVTVRYFDDAGHGVVESDQMPAARVLPLGSVWPGQRVGVTDFVNVDATKVVRMSVTVGAASWVAPTRLDPALRPHLWTTDVTTIPTGSSNVTILAFSTHNGGPNPLSARANALYRDKSGKLIGSSHAYGQLYYPPGISRGSIALRPDDWIPPTADLTRTEITFLGR
jgi:hypothetical protein